MPSRNDECRKYLSSETPTLSKGNRDSLPHFVHFCLIFIELGKGGVHKNSLSNCQFRSNWYSKSHSLLTGVNELLSIVSTFIFLFGESRHKKFTHYSVRHFWVSWKPREGRPCLLKAYECTLKICTVEPSNNLKAKNAVIKICVVRHSLRHYHSSFSCIDCVVSNDWVIHEWWIRLNMMNVKGSVIVCSALM